MYIYNQAKTQILYIPEGSIMPVRFSISSIQPSLGVPRTVYLKINGDIFLSSRMMEESQWPYEEDQETSYIHKIQYGIKHITKLLKEGNHEDTEIWIRDTCDFEVCDEYDKFFS